MPDPRIHPIAIVTDATAGVTDASTVILAANERRADLEIVNDLDVVVYLARGNTAIAGYGIRLNANGGSYSMDTQNIYLGAFSAICNAGEDGSVTISEGAWQ